MKTAPQEIRGTFVQTGTGSNRKYGFIPAEEPPTNKPTDSRRPENYSPAFWTQPDGSYYDDA